MGIVSILGLQLLNIQFFSQRQNQRLLQRLNRIESFYAGELAVWHAEFRIISNIIVSNNPTSVQFDNTPYMNTDRLPTADTYDTSPGFPLNVSRTKQFVPTGSLIRRYFEKNLTYNRKMNGTVCARLVIKQSSRQYSLCLSRPSKPRGFETLAAWGGDLDISTNPPKPRKWIIAKIGSDNQLDPSFGVGGKATLATNNPFHGAVSLALGKDGTFYMESGEGVYTFFPDGRLDTSFGTMGLRAFNAVYSNTIRWTRLLPHSGDSILIWGDNLMPFNLVFNEFHGEFGRDALATLSANGGKGAILTVKAKSDGGFLVAGSSSYSSGEAKSDEDFLMVGSSGSSGHVTWRLIQLKPNGEADSSFDDGGSTGFILQDLVLDSQGRSLSYGKVNGTGSNLSVCRRKSNGSLDSEFGAGGCSTATFLALPSPSIENIAFFGDSQLLAVLSPVNNKILIRRYDLDWRLDPSFGPGGETVVPAFPVMNCSGSQFFSVPTLSILGVQKLTDGAALIALRATGPGQSCRKMAFVKLDSRGKPDESFGTDGIRAIETDDNYLMGVGWAAMEPTGT